MKVYITTKPKTKKEKRRNSIFQQYFEYNREMKINTVRFSYCLLYIRWLSCVYIRKVWLINIRRLKPFITVAIKKFTKIKKSKSFFCDVWNNKTFECRVVQVSDVELINYHIVVVLQYITTISYWPLFNILLSFKIFYIS